MLLSCHYALISLLGYFTRGNFTVLCLLDAGCIGLTMAIFVMLCYPSRGQLETYSSSACALDLSDTRCIVGVTSQSFDQLLLCLQGLIYSEQFLLQFLFYLLAVTSQSFDQFAHIDSKLRTTERFFISLMTRFHRRLWTCNVIFAN